jgi:F-type H+-transporting ATPase subunit epsilon
MNLKILLPSEIFANKANVLRILAQTGAGSFGILPNRLDCVSAIVPGILTYQTEGDGTVYVAVDEGVMVKAGPNVLVSVRHAIGGTDLSQLHAAVRRQFLTLNEQEKMVRIAVAKMESGLIGRLQEFQHER